MGDNWINTEIEMDSIDWKGNTIHLKRVPAIKNAKTGEVRVYPSDVAKAELRMLAETYDIKPRDIPLLLSLIAKPGPFRYGYLHHRYRINKILFYQWKEMEKQELGETFVHDEFEAGIRGPIPKHITEDLERLEKMSIVCLSWEKWGKGPKEASLTTALTKKGIALATTLWNSVPKQLLETTAKVKKELFLLDPIAIKEKVHSGFPEYRKTFKNPDRT